MEGSNRVKDSLYMTANSICVLNAFLFLVSVSSLLGNSIYMQVL